MSIVINSLGKLFLSQTGKIFVCIVFTVFITGTAFGQVSDLSLDASDIRFEPVYSNHTVIGYNLFVRKKTGMESVMLTEPSGYHALRSTEWNSINGSERRELSGVPLSGAYSQYSILSSTPIHDTHFGSAFHLFIPFRFVYGNQSSSAGTVFLQISSGVQINIRTFDHQFADPNTGRYQNNQFIIIDVSVPRDLQYPAMNHVPEAPSVARYDPVPPLPPPPASTASLQDYINCQYDKLRRILVDIVGIDGHVLDSIDDKEDNAPLQRFLLRAFSGRGQRE